MLPFQLASELHPFPLGLIRILGFFLLCEMALPHCSYRSCPALSNLSDIDYYG
jgi:hypothetical protein